MVPAAVLRWTSLAVKYAQYYQFCDTCNQPFTCEQLPCLCPRCVAANREATHTWAILRPNEILAEIWSESTGDPNAANPSDPSFGLMQLTMPIARHYGALPITATWSDIRAKLYDPDWNVKTGCAFLSELKRKYEGSHPLALPDGSPNPTGWVSAFNQGEGNLMRGRADLPYVQAFLSHLQELETEPEAT